ncbi:hypothetical protein H0H87_005096 [Tephrocybe sp. NHM501043]|nr:hypothetical protein H0H87_005096 [Tephrocybe sp. NHM501043]
MPMHVPDGHKYPPVLDEKVIAVVKNFDRQKHCDYLDLITGLNEGMDTTYWKDVFRIKDPTGQEVLCCPGLIYPRTLTAAEVWSRIADRLTPYVFFTPSNWRPDPGDAEDRNAYNGAPEVHKQEPSDLEIRQDDNHRSVARESEERCAMCADRLKYWAVSPPVFLSRHSRRWHLHIDCLQHLMPRRQFGLRPVDVVDFV